MSTTPTYDPDVDKPVEDMLKRASARAEKSLQERNCFVLIVASSCIRAFASLVSHLIVWSS